jgi:DNA-directed RNA polymerase subunit K/omega
MREKSQAQRIEELSNKVGGRFKLTTLALKRIRSFYVGGRTFMPKVRNLDELFENVLDEIEEGKITLKLADEKPRNLLQATQLQLENTDNWKKDTEETDDA